MRLKNRKGITLVELVVAMAILSVIIAASVTVMVTGIKTYNKNLTDTMSQQNLRSAMVKVTRQVRNAPSGAVSVNGSKVLSVSSVSFTVASGKLLYGTTELASGMSSIKAAYVAGTSNKVVQVDLTAQDGTELSTQIRVN